MSNTVDVSVVADDAMVPVRNLTDYPVAYHVPSLGDLRREIPPRGVIRVIAGDYLNVGNSNLAQEFGVSSDTIEYNWTLADIDKALTTDPIEVLMDAMDFAPEGIKETIAKRAVELEISDTNRRKVITDGSNYDIDTMIKNKESIEADEEQKEEKKTTTRRRSSSTGTKTRRAATAKKTETAE